MDARMTALDGWQQQPLDAVLELVRESLQQAYLLCDGSRPGRIPDVRPGERMGSPSSHGVSNRAPLRLGERRHFG